MNGTLLVNKRMICFHYYFTLIAGEVGVVAHCFLIRWGEAKIRAVLQCRSGGWSNDLGQMD